MPEESPNDLTVRLRRLIETIDIANVLTEPITTSINELLAVSAAKMNSEDASVLVREGELGDLRFLAATGKVADQLIGMHVPAGKGIAGFVLMSGQPMAVSDVGEDSTFYAEVDRATGYSTQTILATPLRFKDEIIGVLEFINRSGSQPFAPFTSDELDTAAIYADSIASLVSAHESAKLLRDLSTKVLAESRESDLSAMRDWLAGTRNSAEHRERMDLAVLLREVAGRGDAERKLCRELLESIVRFSDEKGETSYLQY
ncbi:MAG: GAF domain-containing protein [Pyrinomonadaceae bacterium]|nr:GAF domain-containing protein [Acidobacteriota bacterium]MBK7934309.1 GAF domain-containing protein [Acidobacteriota bacterium]MBP7376889.1 GAF domain-containing protein [Pyrinomonadaceae bacterium]